MTTQYNLAAALIHGSVLLNDPAPSVIADPTANTSNPRMTVSFGPNPWPLTNVDEPGGPDDGESEMEGASV